MNVLFLGKMKHPNRPTIAEFLSLGQARGHRVELVSKQLFWETDLDPFDLICMKSHYHDGRVWERIQKGGLRAINDWDSCQRCSRRSTLERVLRAHGIPLPPAAINDSEAVRLKHPIIRKPQSMGEHDIQVLSEPESSFDCQHYFYQQMIQSDRVHKVYCVGKQTFLVEVPYEIQEGWVQSEDRKYVAAVPDTLAQAARRVGLATGLEIYNVDFLHGGDEFLVIDVNPFPGFLGIREAPQAWWDYLERAMS